MIAYNLLESNPNYLQAYPKANKAYEVHKFKNVLYIETHDSNLPYHILERTDEKESDIDYGYLYGYYKIDNVVYSSFLSNSYKAFITDQIDRQTTIFDFIKEEI